MINSLETKFESLEGYETIDAESIDKEYSNIIDENASFIKEINDVISKINKILLQRHS